MSEPKLPDPNTYPYRTYVVEEEQFAPSFLPIVEGMKPPSARLRDVLKMRTTFVKHEIAEDGVRRWRWFRQEDEPNIMPREERL